MQRVLLVSETSDSFVLFVVQINTNAQTTNVHKFACVGLAVLFAVVHIVFRQQYNA